MDHRLTCQIDAAMNTASRSRRAICSTELQPGDRVEVDARGQGRLVQDLDAPRPSARSSARERRRHGLHFRRQSGRQGLRDMIVLKRDDGELTTVTMDEFTELAPAELVARDCRSQSCVRIGRWRSLSRRAIDRCRD